ncbi:MAG: FtsW/RodA/SpoVE family cell cycle protein [Oscillospiraceae bacterium]|nr:FtsW/RodA/SpoVE family cell cycle protein [Oscillospiraceae bacterium]
MSRIWSSVKRYLKNGDTLLLSLCIAASVFGILIIASATKSMEDSSHFVVVQSAALVIGVIVFVIFSLIDIDLLCDRWKLLLLFNTVFIAILLIFGVEGDTGNRSWISYSWMPIGIQPAEIVKLTFTLLMARQMYAYRDRINSPGNIVRLAGHILMMLLLILVCSKDAGMALVYAVIFVFMAFAAGISIPWFLAGAAAVALVVPVLWNSSIISEYQKDRIMIIFSPEIDPQNLDIGWHAAQSKLAIGSGRLTGQGLFHGNMTQSGGVFAMHTDFVFAGACEELGLIGGCAIIALLTGIIVCCLVRAVKCKQAMGALICTGYAGMLIFQTFENIGMCLGITPVIGLTLPFFSYGGSSLVTLFACMGIVSGFRLKPPPIVPRY